MRALYTLLWLFVLPFAFLHLLRRARRQPEYRAHWGERLGLLDWRPDRPVIWLHAVSVGETRAAAPLVKALRQRYPDHALLLTHATPTGRATGAELFGDTVTQAYLPYDLPWAVDRFLDRTHPRLAIVMETEVWPNLYAACRRRRIPTFLVNARLSARSARGYGRVAALVRPALAGLTGIAAQTGADAERLSALGGRSVQVTGNLKFDVQPPGDTTARADDLKRRFAGRFVFLAASTREGEEALILDHCLNLDIPDLLLVMVPRHPQRFDAVAQMIAQHGQTPARRSRNDAVTPATRVYLGDSMGEMAAYYSAAQVAFVGGSLLPLGGQNLIEAAAMGCPVLVGPHTFNFQEATRQAIQTGAALEVADARELADQLSRLHASPAERQAMAEAGRAFNAAHGGATRRVMALIETAYPG